MVVQSLNRNYDDNKPLVNSKNSVHYYPGNHLMYPIRFLLPTLPNIFSLGHRSIWSVYYTGTKFVSLFVILTFYSLFSLYLTFLFKLFLLSQETSENSGTLLISIVSVLIHLVFLLDKTFSFRTQTIL